jgi:hypothetical protein
MSNFALTIQQNEAVQLRAQDGETVLALPVPISGVNVAGSPVFVWQPGGVAGGNVYTTFPALDAAMGLVAGPKTLLGNGTLGALTVPAGTWKNAFQDVTWFSEAGETVSFAAGAIIDPTVTNCAMARGINWQNVGGTVWTPTAASVLFYMYDVGTGFGGLPGATFIHVPAGVSFDVQMTSGSGFGDTVNSAISFAAGSTFGLSNIGGTLLANSLAGTATFNYLVDSAAETDYPIGLPVTVFTYFGPANVLQEVDAAGIGAGVTIAQNSVGTLQRKGSGRVLCEMTASFTQGGGVTGTVTMQVTRDGAAIAGSGTSVETIPSGETQNVKASFVDTLPDNATHHYGWTATTSAGTIAVAGGAANLIAVEQL